MEFFMKHQTAGETLMQEYEKCVKEKDTMRCEYILKEWRKLCFMPRK